MGVVLCVVGDCARVAVGAVAGPAGLAAADSGFAVVDSAALSSALLRGLVNEWLGRGTDGAVGVEAVISELIAVRQRRRPCEFVEYQARTCTSRSE